MNVQLTFDSKSFSRDMNQLRILLKKSGPEIVKQESRLYVRDAIKLTPPCGRHAITESFSEQRKMGIKRIISEVTRLFPVITAAHIMKEAVHARAYKYVKRYIKSGNKQAIRKILTDFGINVPVMLDEATSEVHRSARDGKGRVRKGVQYFVFAAASVRKLIAELLTHIGKGKAGWMVPARALGVKVPNWISRHSAPGVFIDSTKNNFAPYMDVGNLVPHANDAGARMGIAQAAMTNRRRSMRIRIEKMVAHLAKKRGAFLP